jgi:hypothetical protein
MGDSRRCSQQLGSVVHGGQRPSSQQLTALSTLATPLLLFVNADSTILRDVDAHLYSWARLVNERPPESLAAPPQAPGLKPLPVP